MERTYKYRASDKIQMKMNMVSLYAQMAQKSIIPLLESVMLGLD